MKKFRIEQPVLDLFPEVRIGILICQGIDNRIKAADRYAAYLAEAQQQAQKYVGAEVFTENPVVETWREAFRQFKTKKGARCSIEALLKRASKGEVLGTINPLVDIYNGVSLQYGVPVGGENLDAIKGDLRLTVADGNEEFLTLGSEKSEPPYPQEVIYKDDGGAVCRCFNWRESMRTMLTEETTNAFMCIEAVKATDEPQLRAALKALKERIETELGGECRIVVLTATEPEVVIE